MKNYKVFAAAYNVAGFLERFATCLFAGSVACIMAYLMAHFMGFYISIEIAASFIGLGVFWVLFYLGWIIYSNEYLSKWFMSVGLMVSLTVNLTLMNINFYNATEFYSSNESSFPESVTFDSIEILTFMVISFVPFLAAMLALRFIMKKLYKYGAVKFSDAVVFSESVTKTNKNATVSIIKNRFKGTIFPVRSKTVQKAGSSAAKEKVSADADIPK